MVHRRLVDHPLEEQCFAAQAWILARSWRFQLLWAHLTTGGIQEDGERIAVDELRAFTGSQSKHSIQGLSIRQYSFVALADPAGVGTGRRSASHRHSGHQIGPTTRPCIQGGATLAVSFTSYGILPTGVGGRRFTAIAGRLPIHGCRDKSLLAFFDGNASRLLDCPLGSG